MHSNSHALILKLLKILLLLSDYYLSPWLVLPIIAIKLFNPILGKLVKQWVGHI